MISLYTHPTFIVFTSAILLLLFRNYTKIFNWLLIINPLISIFGLFYNSNRYDTLSIFNLNLISDITNEKFQIASAFIYITFFASRLAFNNNGRREIIIGNFANSAAFLYLFAQDFISMFIGLELLMVASTILIFMGDLQNNTKVAKQYFITHLFSSGLILIGISYFVTVKGSTEIVPLTDLITNKEQGFLFYILLLIGCLINIAALPFSGWFVNCYTKASGSGFIYLTAFSTKVTIIMLIKLFSGLAALKFVGIVMMIYGSIYACLEENLRKILCYLIISQLGLMVVAISIGTRASIAYITTYIPIHIYYIALFIYLVILLESIDIKNCNQIKSIKNFTFTINAFIAILMISNFPLTVGFIAKLVLFQNNLGNFTYYLVSILNSMIFVALPFREYFTKQNRLNVSMPNHDKSVLFSLILIIIVSNITLLQVFLPSSNHSIDYIIDIITEPIIKQLIIIATGITFAIIIKIPRCSTSNINLDLYQYIEKLIYFIIDKYKETTDNNEDTEEYLNFKVIWDNILSTISTWHNQQTAIFIVLFLLISLILTLCHTMA